MPIPDEKARAWTRPEDYWPPLRLRRRGPAPLSDFKPAGSGDRRQSRPMLEVVPYALLMLSLAVLALAIIILAWPGRSARTPRTEPAAAEIGTAPKGWIDQN